MKTRYIILILSIVIISIISGCLTSQKSSNGIVIEANQLGGGSITNTNNYSVTIKAVWISGFGGEQTVWIKEFSPDEKWQGGITDNIINNRFYISRNGTEIGYI